MTARILIGDCRKLMPSLAAGSIKACVTSPPFYRLRDYGEKDQIGQENDRDSYVAEIVAVFREVKRLLCNDGSLWLQLGDTYAAGGNGGGGSLVAKRRQWTGAHERKGFRKQPVGFKEKDLMLTPFAIADALRADGWFLRSTIIWDKIIATEPPRLDRPSTAHEYIFVLTKGKHSAIRNPGESWFLSTVWSIRPQGMKVDHPAVMAAEVARRCIISSTIEGDTVFDPFLGSGTTAISADRLNRNCVGIELNQTWAELSRQRFKFDAGMFAEAAE